MGVDMSCEHNELAVRANGRHVVQALTHSAVPATKQGRLTNSSHKAMLHKVKLSLRLMRLLLLPYVARSDTYGVHAPAWRIHRQASPKVWHQLESGVRLPHSPHKAALHDLPLRCLPLCPLHGYAFCMLTPVPVLPCLPVVVQLVQAPHV